MFSKKKINPLEDNVFWGMIRFSIPIVAASLFTMLFSSADMAVIGRFGHENAVASIATSSAVISTIVGAITSLSIGVTVTTGNLYGKNDKEKINELVNSLPLTAFIIGLVTTCFVEIFAEEILLLIDCPQEIWNDAILYFRVYFLALPFTAVYCFLNALLEGSGDSFHPLQFQLCSFIINIILNLVFVIVIDWNVLGVAIATFISQFICCLCMIKYLYLRTDELSFVPYKQHLFKNTSHVWKIGVPSTLESLCMSATAVFIGVFMNHFSPDVIAGNAIGQNLDGIIAVSFVGFSSASVVFISQNISSRNYKRVKKCFIYSIASVFLIGEILGMLIYLNSERLIHLFTTSKIIMETAHLRLLYMCPLFGLCGTMNTLFGCIRGLGDSRNPLIISLLCSVGFRITWLLCVALPNQSLQLCYVCFPICWGLITFFSLIVFVFDFRCILKAKSI